jgi:hypothetical protein
MSRCPGRSWASRVETPARRPAAHLDTIKVGRRHEAHSAGLHGRAVTGGGGYVAAERWLSCRAQCPRRHSPPRNAHDPERFALSLALEQPDAHVDAATRGPACPQHASRLHGVAMDPRAARLDRLGPLGRYLRRRVVKGVTSSIFGSATDTTARIRRDTGRHVATYRFDGAPGSAPPGACHCLDLALLFDHGWEDAPMLANKAVPAKLADEMKRVWVTFAHGGVEAIGRDHRTFA